MNDRVIVVGAGDRVIEFASQVRAEWLAKGPNVKVVRRRRDRQIMRIQLQNFGDDSRLEIHRGNPRRYSHDHESEENPRGVWTMRRLRSDVRDIYQASIIDCLAA